MSNESVSFINENAQEAKQQPFFMMIATPGYNINKKLIVIKSDNISYIRFQNNKFISKITINKSVLVIFTRTWNNLTKTQVNVVEFAQVRPKFRHELMDKLSDSQSFALVHTSFSVNIGNSKVRLRHVKFD